MKAKPNNAVEESLLIDINRRQCQEVTACRLFNDMV